MSTRPRIGELLVAAGLLTQEQLALALDAQRERGAGAARLGHLLVELGYVAEAALTRVLSQHLSVPWVSLHHIDFSRQLLNLLPREIAEEFCLIPIYVRKERKAGDTLYLAMEDPTHNEAIRRVTEATGLPVKSMIAAPSDIRSAIRAYYGGSIRPPAAEVSDQLAGAPAAVREAPAAPAAKPAVKTPPPPPSGPPAGTRSAASPQHPPSPAPAAAAPAVPRPAAPTTPAPAVAPSTAPAMRAAEGATAEPAAKPAVVPVKRRPSEGGEPTPALKPAPKMVALTLLDGTTIQIPSQRKRAAAPDAPEPPRNAEEQLTTRDLIAALRAVANGAPADEALGDARWETLFAALLTVLMKKQLIADWEFVEEWRKM